MSHNDGPTDRSHRLSRRAFLRGSSLSAAAALLAACGVEAPQPAAPAAAPSPTLPPPTAAVAPTAAAIAPTAAAQPALGAQLIGQLEGPTVITDLARFPASFTEAPALAQQVQAGALPPLAERLPAASDLLVLQPAHGIGSFGGLMRRGFTGPGDHYNGKRTAAHDHILYFDYTMNQVVPNVAKGYAVSDDGATITVSLREGMKWSDGAPFGADDFVFWYEDMYLNPEIVSTTAPGLAINGQQGRIEKVDDLTVRYVFPEPYALFPEVIAGFASIASHATWGNTNMGGFAPAHYLKQFHPKYAEQAAVDQAIADAKVENLATLFNQKNDWALNPDLPTVTPWKTVSPINTPTWALERNPYFYAVDTEGNQLPYLDRIEMTLAEDLEVLNLRAIAGAYDFQERHLNIQNLPTFLESREQGGYNVHLDPAGDCTALVRFNMSYEKDPELARLFTTREFRQALALGVDRDQINETFMLGLGTPGSVVPADDNKYNPGAQYRTLWATYDPDQANAMLDGLGLTQKDAQGRRLRGDGQGPLTLTLMATAAQFLPYAKMGEMLREQWRALGITVEVEELERNLATERTQANDVQLHLWDGGNGARLFGQPSNILPDGLGNSMGPRYGQWFATGGAEGKEPPAEIRRLMEIYRTGFGVGEEERVELGKEFWRIHAEQVFTIGLVGMAPAVLGLRIAKAGLGNVPARQDLALDGFASGISRPETFYWKA